MENDDNDEWRKVPSKDVKSIWKCEKCGELAKQHPDEVGEAGIPFCPDCGDDMTYQETLIRVKKP
jgi:formylmethanofuran dehydrogenase subunit E